MYALIDGNRFYASCEAIFRPDLIGTDGQPVGIAVVSNNDGCVVTRSRRAQEQGIDNFMPYFQIKDYCREQGIEIFSSNYELYGSISQRMMDVIASQSPQIEVYSIDECFADLDGMRCDLKEWGRKVKEMVWKQVGIPVCVGIGPTKTLAKLANHTAKQLQQLQGVCLMDTPVKWGWMLERIQPSDIWGVGARIEKRLKLQGIVTGKQLASAPPKIIRKDFSVVLERTVRELNGESCIPLELEPAPQKQIVCSRSFGKKITERVEIEQAIASYVERAAAKLRSQGALAQDLMIRIETSRFDKSAPFYGRSQLVRLPYPTCDTGVMISGCVKAASSIFREGLRYARASVFIPELIRERGHQLPLLGEIQSAKSQQLMSTLDSINQRFGRGTLQYAASGIKPKWQMARRLKSPAYTTRWSEIPKVYAN